MKFVSVDSIDCSASTSLEERFPRTAVVDHFVSSFFERVVCGVEFTDVSSFCVEEPSGEL